jgi:riboflavin-specific deaminase-like protein
MNLFPEIESRAHHHFKLTHKPLVLVTFAQSLDGSISTRRDQQLRLSGPDSQAMTHQLRASHDAILVGIGTVMVDDPRLTARLAEGKNPQPVIVDTHLRFPLNARLLTNPDLRPWLVTCDKADPATRQRLESSGAQVLVVPLNTDGLLDLGAMLTQLGDKGITSLMVEGGARVITSFLKYHLADWMVITLTPRLIGGLNVIDPSLWGLPEQFPRLARISSQPCGGDLILWGDLLVDE